MTVRMTIALICNSLVTVVFGGVGIAYLLSGEITSYHKQVIGVEWESLAPGVQLMMLVLMKGTGLAVLITGITVGVLSWIPVRQGQNWARWATLLIGMTCLVPMLAGASYLAITTGASSPWWLNAILMISVIIAFILAASPNGTSS
jgi:hypothetical protein